LEPTTGVMAHPDGGDCPMAADSKSSVNSVVCALVPRVQITSAATVNVRVVNFLMMVFMAFRLELTLL